MTYEQMCLFKLFCSSMGMMDRNNITNAEMEVACESLKHMADQRYDWTDQQKNTYKFLVDYAKEMTKSNAD